MKVFVGTMESGEADFPACREAIMNQTHSPTFHYIVSGMTEPEAHRRLYEEWEAAKADFDLFLKVDADTVLAHPNVIAATVALFAANPRLTGTQAWLYDHMTATKIFGLGCMRNTVRLATRTNPLYPDRVDFSHDQVLRGDSLPDALNPAGYHCRTVNDAQAFHYGLHRMLKGQADTLARVRTAWLHHGGRDRALALLGSRRAPDFKQHLRFNYGDAEFQTALAETLQRLPELTTEMAREEP